MADVITIAAHPDDAELAMGGTLLALKAQGLTTAVIDLTSGEPTPFGDPDTRVREAARASEILGLDARYTLDLPTRWLRDTDDARVKIAEIIRRERPGVVFIPYWRDAHPDHVAAHDIAVGAIFTARLTKMDIPREPYRTPRVFHHLVTHLKLNPQASFVLDVSGFLDKKIEACRAYQSQFTANEPGARLLARVEAAARYWGSLIGTAAAEPFVARDQLGLKSIRDLL